MFNNAGMRSKLLIAYANAESQVQPLTSTPKTSYSMKFTNFSNAEINNNKELM